MHARMQAGRQGGTLVGAGTAEETVAGVVEADRRQEAYLVLLALVYLTHTAAAAAAAAAVTAEPSTAAT